MTARRPSAAVQPPAGKWADLSRRVASTLVLLGIGILLAVATGVWLRLAMAMISAVTFWELAAMTGWKHPRLHPGIFGAWRPFALAVIAFMSQVVATMSGQPAAVLALLFPLVAGIPGAAPRDRWTYAVFGLAIMLVAFGLVGFREEFGLSFVLWLMGIVILSDTAGYFFGRMIGGPKFWPALSPKKTWSGTIAGWICAALLGGALHLSGRGDLLLVWISPLVCLAGQMGDIAESWLKRRAGVKDSSNLIPGHGGFMDRFDAVTGAVLAAMLIQLLDYLPTVT